MGDVLSEEFENPTKCEHRIWLVKHSLGEAHPLITTERENKSVRSRNVLSFSDSEVFAVAKVKLLCSEVCAVHKWSCYAVKFVLCTSEVKFAHHFAVRRNFTHEVNFTIEDNFTCPKGKLSFSVFSVKDNTLRTLFIFTFYKLSQHSPRGSFSFRHRSNWAA